MKITYFGPPAGGKGTVSKRIGNRFGLMYVSSGDICRDEIARGTELGVQLRELNENQGKLTPDDIIMRMVLPKIAGQDNYQLDGVPRTISQALTLEQETSIDLAVYIHVPDEISKERQVNRRKCSLCGRVYNLLPDSPFRPKVEEKCDDDLADLIARKDDNHETAQKRLAEYHKNTAPLVGFYRQRGLIFEVDGSLHPDVVYDLLERTIEELLARNNKT